MTIEDDEIYGKLPILSDMVVESEDENEDRDEMNDL